MDGILDNEVQDEILYNEALHYQYQHSTIPTTPLFPTTDAEDAECNGMHNKAEETKTGKSTEQSYISTVYDYTRPVKQPPKVPQRGTPKGDELTATGLSRKKAMKSLIFLVFPTTI